jgi:hypothetical protein
MRIWLSVVLIVALLVYLQQSSQPSHRAGSLASQILHPFDPRVHYRIGEIDPRFGLSRPVAEQLAREAAAIWNQAVAKPLLVYDEQATLSINLRYDDRQAESTMRHSVQQTLKHELDSQQTTANQLRQQQQQLEQQQRQLTRQQTDFSQHQLNYNRNVEAWNTLGTIDSANRQQLEQQRNALAQEQQALNRAMAAFNQQVDQLNQQAGVLNNQADLYNQQVSNYQRRFVPREFEKGSYNGRQINIYEFSTAADLRLTMAHELGHALGLMHTSDPKSLMHPVLGQQDFDHFRLTVADLALLQKR